MFSTFSLHFDLPSFHPMPAVPNSCSLFNVHTQYKFPHLLIPALHHFVSASSPSPSQPFNISFLRLSLPLPQARGWVHNSVGNFISLGALRAPPSVTYVLNVRRWIRSCLPRLNVRSPRRGHQAVHPETLPIGDPGQWLRLDLRFLPSTVQEFPSHSHLLQAIPSRSFVTHPFVLKSQAHGQKKHCAIVTQHHLSLGSFSSETHC